MSSIKVSALLIEDNDSDARLIKEYLREARYIDFQVNHTRSIEEALDILEHRHTDIILLDINLPDSSWPKSLYRVIDCYPHIPVVVITGVDDEQRAVTAIKKGAQDYISKNDLTPSLLIKTIRYAIERHRLKMLFEDASENVRESELRLRNIINNHPDGIAIVNIKGITRFLNPTMECILGKKKEEIIGKPFDYLNCFKDSHCDKKWEFEIEQKSAKLWIEAQLSPIKWAEEEALIVGFRDITERRNAEKRIRLAAKVMESTLDAVVITDKDFAILEVNKAFTDITGYNEQDLKGKTIDIMAAGEYEKSKYQNIMAQVRDKEVFQGEIHHRRKDGDKYIAWLTLNAIKNGLNQITNYAAVFTDITQRKLFEDKLKRLAHYDVLTGLPNRLLFNDRLEHAISTADRHKEGLAVMFIDLDGFKLINDSSGHDVGDLVLIEVAERIRRCLRGSDTVARFGGDEFAVLIENLRDPEDIPMLATKILEAVRKPLLVSDHTYSLGASIGVCLYPAHGDTAEKLLKCADVAMYEVKNSGKNGFKVFGH